jgi:tetratricopeptide (TPR) repeat protein
MARVDALPERAKEILKVGSVIEREFSHELIRKITNLPEADLLTQMSTLKDAELLYERGIYPQLSYVFKHALTREVIYDSLLTQKKRSLHEAIGKAIEELYPRQLGEYYHTLSEHFTRSENFPKGAEYAKLAGKSARGKSAYKDAIHYAKKEVSCLEHLPKSEPNRKKILDARIALANYCMNLNYHAEAKEAISPILEWVEEANDPKALAAVYTTLGSHALFVEENHAQGREYLQEALRLAEEGKDYFSFWNACYVLGCFLSWNCEFEKAQEYFYKSLDLSLAARNVMGITSAQINLGMNYIFQGKIVPAYQISQESLRMAEESGDIYLKGMAHASHGTSCYYRGDYREAEDHLLKGISFCEKTTHFTWGAWAAAFMGDMYFDLEKYEDAQEAYRKSLKILGDKKFSPSWITLLNVAILRARVLHREAEGPLDELPKSFAANKNRGFSGWIAQYIAEILLNQDSGDIQEAEAWANKALGLHQENGMRLLLGRDYLLHAELQKRRGNPDKAKEHLNQAINIFQECGANGYLQKAKKEWIHLSSLSFQE